jgi:hypothetical protein
MLGADVINRVGSGAWEKHQDASSRSRVDTESRAVCIVSSRGIGDLAAILSK